MTEYNFGSIMNRDFILELKRMAEDVNVQGKTIQDLVADGQLTEEQYAELIIAVNGLIKSGYIDKSDLTPEFKDEIEGLSTQLAQTATELHSLDSDKMDKSTTDISVNQINKNKGKFDQTYMTDEFLQQITGEAPVNATPPDGGITSIKLAEKAVTPYKIDGAEIGRNLFNPSKITPNAYLSTSGELSIPYEGVCVSDFIPVLGNETYTVSRDGRVAFYTSEKEFISFIENTGQGGGGKTFTTPENTKFMRHTTQLDRIKETKTERGSVKTPYEPFSYRVEGLATSSIDTSANTQEIVYDSNGLVNSVIEKDSSGKIVSTNTLVYEDGKVVKNETISNGIKVTENIIYVGGKVTGITKNVVTL